jgi:hypothetical protein
MKRTMLAAAMALGVAGALPGAPSAEDATGFEQIAVSQHRFETTLIVEALPLEAQIQVDGRAIGTASEVTGTALSVGPGTHTVRITAPGFRPYVGSFFADTLSSANQFKVVLAPQ